MERNKYLLLVLMWCCSHLCYGQDTLRLSHDEFLAIVKSYHPMAFKYRLQNRIADENVRYERGNFDPVLDGKSGAKTIDGIDYYQQQGVGLNIPTWYGVTVNGSYSYLDGEKLNNSDTRGGLYQVGLTVPLAKNLLYDKRRALLEQAHIARRMTEAEQTLLTNELLLDAENSYWEWVKQYEGYRIQREAVRINRRRMDLVVKTLSYGEQAAIDTTEARAQLQRFELQERDAYFQYLNATQELSLFMWRENREPYDVTQWIIPSEELDDNMAHHSYQELLARLDAQSLNRHAALRYYDEKGNILDSDRRLKLQSLLPKVDFTYNFFKKDGYAHNFFPFFDNNYQYGVKLEIPVFLRQARADYNAAKLKIGQNTMDFNFKRQELVTKMNRYRNEVINYAGQIDMAKRNASNYEKLLTAEETKYANGESSLFLINSRENKVIEANEKIIELYLKFLKSYNSLKWMNESFSDIPTRGDATK
ncbi:TolC family protein [Sphingobacterium olei]|uniref:TolC family protein n=1 Tax=Sphingobacterium olei TaxID=2571155 RepID=A0A4U0NYH8_9SPHI|nr:TolC family protein [Sphingobacterium olei]TJZ59917.1 TolC family protein [Sphingobacterium olei]